MSTWRDSLLPASFRGVGFVIESSSVPVGRKGQLHEFVQRDEPFFEQLGKQAQVHKLTGFVIGSDCFVKRDKLLEAIGVVGAGELVHPWLGRMQVKAGECEITHDRREGGMVRFDMTFYPDVPRKFPTGTVNTRQQVTKASDSLLSSGMARYKAAIAVVDQGRINVLGLQRSVSSVYSAITGAFSPLLTTFNSVSTFADSLISAPSSLSSMLSSYFSVFSAGSSSTSSSSGSEYRGAVASASQQTEALVGINTVSQASGADTGLAAQAAANLVQDALLVQVALLVSEMPVAGTVVTPDSTPALDQQVEQPIERPEVPVADDVLALRDSLDEAIWTASLKADSDHYLALNTLRLGVTKHLTAVAASGVRLVDIKPEQSLPALVLAYRRFGDATRAAEVVQRNAISHPGFVPPVTIKIAQE